METITKTNVKGMAKDLTTGAILNTDNDALNTYKMARDRRNSQKKLIETMREDIEDIKDQLRAIAKIVL